jgi:hypothetical protein
MEATFPALYHGQESPPEQQGVCQKEKVDIQRLLRKDPH